MIINILNSVIRGWGNYFSKGIVKELFKRLDEWIRMKLSVYIEKKEHISIKIRESQLLFWSRRDSTHCL